MQIESLYTIAAQVLFYIVMVATTVVCLVWLANWPNLLKQVFTVPRVFVVLVLIIGQTAATFLALAAYAFDLVPPNTLAMVLGSWLLVGMACLIAPAGFGFDDEVRREPEGLASRRALAITGLATVGIIVWSYGWLLGLGHFVEVKESGFLPDATKLDFTFLLLTMVALLAPIQEELIFRLGLQGSLEWGCARIGAASWPAVVISSIVWSLGHAGMVTPVGFKEAQLLVVGGVLGYLRVRFGFWACLVAHLGLNSTAMGIQFVMNLMEMV